MAVKIPAWFTSFSPNLPYSIETNRSKTLINFSRWNNANAEKHIRRERAQQEIEQEIRLEKKDELASKITEQSENSTAIDPPPYFKSVGTPSTPSRPSIAGKFSKYSKNRGNSGRDLDPHPAFRRIGVSRVSRVKSVAEMVNHDAEKGIRLGDHGVSYKFPDAPFEFQYSYTETPKVKPLALREQPFPPFGPSTMPRPWTGRAPLPPSKKKLPEFDSFRLPPAHKKGVKPVQSPGPFLPGTGPRYVQSREEILGEPLMAEEVQALVESCLRSKRQLNMGRDGLTHNMLDNIHALWKRRRVCKIKCKGVCTVDMDNVHQQLEEKTGGKIIYSRGGVLYLFRGRNYNYRTRPRYPLMLWKPVTPVYPRLVGRVPEELTLEEASEMRKRGRKLPPICKLGKNGVYLNLVKHVKEAFEECELVRINCQGMNKSDYKKIGAKLKDLVPCVLISFESEHILMWRGRDWKPSLPTSTDDSKLHQGLESAAENPTADLLDSADSLYVESLALDSSDENSSNEEKSQEMVGLSSFTDKNLEETDLVASADKNEPLLATTDLGPTGTSLDELTTVAGSIWRSDELGLVSVGAESCPELADMLDSTPSHTELAPMSETRATENSLDRDDVKLSTAYLERVMMLQRQAVESGMALVLDGDCLDANVVYEKAVFLAQTAPPGPIFRNNLRKFVVQTGERQQNEDLTVEVVAVSKKKGSDRSVKSQRRKELCPDEIPQGSLRVDELAKLLA